MRTWFSTRPLLSRVAALLLALLVVAAFAVPAEAYVLTHKRRPKRWTSYEFQTNFLIFYRETARAAEGDWMQGPVIDFRFDEVASLGKVELYYGQFSFFPRDDDGVIAYARTENNGLWKTGVDIVMNPDREWQPDVNGVEVLPPPDHFSIRSVLRHEFGHAAGVGHSQDPNANMYFSFQPRERRGINRNDTLGLSYYYDTNFDEERPRAKGDPNYKYYAGSGYLTGTAQEDARVVYYAGGWDEWQRVVIPNASGGFLSWIGGKKGAKILVPYEGQCITRIYTKAYNRGDVEVRLDGILRATVSEQGDGVQRRAKRTFCANSTDKHTIEFRKLCDSSECFMDADAFIVDETTTAIAQVSAAGELNEGIAYQQDHEAVEYIGNWGTFDAEEASNGSLSFTENQWDAVSFSFEGKQVEWCYSRASNRGKAGIMIDSEEIGTIDLYSSKIERNQCWVSPELEPGLHHLYVVAKGEKHKDSSSTLIDVDHFIVH